MKGSIYEELDVFKISHCLVVEVYQILENFPKAQQYVLISQLSRSVSSIPANIAEGFGRSTLKDKKRFLIISRASTEETKYHLLLARDLNYISEKQYKYLYEKSTRIIRMLNSLIKSLKK